MLWTRVLVCDCDVEIPLCAAGVDDGADLEGYGGEDGEEAFAGVDAVVVGVAVGC